MFDKLKEIPSRLALRIQISGGQPAVVSAGEAEPLLTHTSEAVLANIQLNTTISIIVSEPPVFLRQSGT
jgi:hypothetical protein